MSCSFRSFIVLSALFLGTQAQCPWAGGGLTTVTAPGADWVISSPVLLDTAGPLTLNSITIQSGGDLVFQNRNLSLTVNSIVVETGGALTIGSEVCPFTATLTVTLTGPTSGNEDKAITARVGSVVDIHGVVPVPTWTRLSRAIPKEVGTTRLQEPVDWKRLDRIVFAGTDHYQDESEDVLVARVHSSRTVVYHERTQYPHWADENVQGEVGKLNRNVVIQGDDTPLLGGQFRIETAVARISGVEFLRMGQTLVEGRYPIHFRSIGDVTGSYVTGCTGHQLYNRFIVLVDIQNLVVSENIGYGTIGHMYAMIEGANINNVFTHNLGMAADTPSAPFLPNENQPAIFYITNPLNVVNNNAAACAFHGFRSMYPEKPIGSSAAKYAADPTMWPLAMPLGSFNDNVAHSMNGDGWTHDHSLSIDGDYAYSGWRAEEAPYDEDGDGVRPLRQEVSGMKAYKIRGYGIKGRAQYLTIRNAFVSDSVCGFMLYGSAVIVEDSVVVGESDNLGVYDNYHGAAWYEDRTRPHNLGYIGGINLNYGDATRYRRITFRNFVSDAIRPAAALAFMSGSPMYGSFFVQDLTFENAQRVVAPDATAFYRDSDLGYLHGMVLNDHDGSVTGTPHAKVVQSPWLARRLGGCTFNAEWNAYVCPPSKPLLSFELLKLDPDNIDLAGKPAYGYDFGFLTEFGTDDSLSLSSDDMNRVALIPDRGYDITYPHPTPDQLRLLVHFVPESMWVVFSLPYPASALPLSVTYDSAGSDSLPEVASVEELRDYESAWFYDAASERVFIRMAASYTSIVESDDTVLYRSARYVFVYASCGLSCSVTPSPAPAAIAFSSEYRAYASGCGATPAVATSRSAHVFAAIEAATGAFHFQVYHDLGTDVTEIQFYSPSEDRVLYQFTEETRHVTQGLISFSFADHVKLYSGDLQVRLATAAHPAGEVVGTFGCSLDACTAPTTLEGDPCDTSGGTLLYGDGFEEDYRISYWRDSRDETTESMCGTTSLFINASNYAGFNLRASSTSANPYISIPADATHLSFFVRSDVPSSFPGRAPFVEIRSRNSDNTADIPSSYVRIDYYTDGYRISHEWARAVIPLSDLSIPAPIDVYQINLRIIFFDGLPDHGYYFDQIAFLASPSTTRAPTAASAAIFAAPPVCRPVDTTPPTVTAVSPADGETRLNNVEGVVRVYFSEPVALLQDFPALVTVANSVEALEGEIYLEGDNNVVVFKPSSPWLPREIHTVTVSAALTDASGNALGADVISRFASEDSTQPLMVTAGIAGRMDDASEETGDAEVHLYRWSLEMYTDWLTSVRFRRVPLLPAATVVSAAIQFTSYYNLRDRYADYDIWAELSPNSRPFYNDDGDLSSRTATDAVVRWTGAPDPLPQNDGLHLPWDWEYRNDRGEVQQTADVTPIVNELLALPDWKAGNAMSFFFNATLDTSNRIAFTADSHPGKTAELQVEITMDGERDLEPPTVVSQTPATLTRDVEGAAITSISISFSEHMHPESAEGIRLLDRTAGRTVPTRNAVWTDFSSVTLEHDALNDATLYCINVREATASDLGHNWLTAYEGCFTTVGFVDTTIPSATAVLPATPTDPIVLTFSEPMSPAATEAAFSVVWWRYTDTYEAVAPAVSWNSRMTVLTAAAPNATWAYDQIYIVSLSADAVDASGTAIPSPYEWRFATCDQDANATCIDPNTAVPPENPDAVESEEIAATEEEGLSVGIIIAIAAGGCCFAILCCGAIAAIVYKVRSSSDGTPYKASYSTMDANPLAADDIDMTGIAVTSPARPLPAAPARLAPNPGPPPPPTKSAPPVPPAKPKGVTTQYDFVGESADQLSFYAGETLYDVKDCGDGWSEGTTANGQWGYFPSSYAA